MSGGLYCGESGRVELRDWSLIIGRWGGGTKREGEATKRKARAVKFHPCEGGGADKVYF